MHHTFQQEVLIRFFSIQELFCGPRDPAICLAQNGHNGLTVTDGWTKSYT